MEVTININAPELIEAINRLAEIMKKMSGTPYATVVPNTIQNAPTASVETVQHSIPVNGHAAITLAPQQNVPVQQAAAQPVVDEAYRTRVSTAAAQLIDQGKMADVLAALNSCGVQAVTQLNATQLGEFAAKITALGAVI